MDGGMEGEGEEGRAGEGGREKEGERERDDSIKPTKRKADKAF